MNSTKRLWENRVGSMRMQSSPYTLASASCSKKIIFNKKLGRTGKPSKYMLVFCLLV